MNRVTPTLVLALALAPLALPACDGADDVPPAVAADPRIPVVLDYSPTVSDAGALLYLAANPEVDLLAVTLSATGEADCAPGVRATGALLAAAGRDGVPIGCSDVAPAPGRDWPQAWRADANALADELSAPPIESVDAVALLSETLAGADVPVVVVATGPLTNLAAVLSSEPALLDKVDRFVVMGGAVDTGGNVEAHPAAEWNLWVDPPAAQQVIGSGAAVTLVGLDATNSVPLTERLVASIGGLDTPAAAAEHSLLAPRSDIPGLFLWDELAAMASLVPGVVRTEALPIAVDADGVTRRSDAGTVIDVALLGDADAATGEFLRVLNGGTAPTVTPLTAAEIDYLIAMGELDSELNADMADLYGRLDAGGDQDAGMRAFVDGFIANAENLAAGLQEVDPPAALRDAHERYRAAVAAVAGRRAALLAVLDGATGGLDATFEAIGKVIEAPLDELRAACQLLEDYSFQRGGPRPCSASQSG